MNTVIIVVAIGFFVAVLAGLLFVSREGGGWRFHFKLGKHFSGGASGSGRGASITKSTSTEGAAAAIDKTGHSAHISETTAKGNLSAEVSDTEAVKKQDLRATETTAVVAGSTAGGSMFAIAISNSPHTQLVLDTSGPHDAEIDEARALLLARKPDEARVVLERKKRRHWDQLSGRQRYRVLANIGAALMQLAEIQEAAAQFLLAGEQLPEDPDAQAFRAWGLEIGGRHAEAFEIASRVVQQHSTKRAAAILVRCAPRDASLDELERRLGELRDEPEALAALSIRAVNARAFDKAYGYLDRLIAKEPDSPDGHFLRGQALMHEQLAKFQGADEHQVNTLEKERLIEAETAISRALELARIGEQVPVMKEMRGGALFVRHQIRFMLNQKDASEADLEEALRLHPRDPNVLVSKALNIREHRKQLALAYIERASELSDDERVRFLHGEMLIACDRVEEGVARLMSVANEKGDMATDAIGTIAEVWIERKRLDDAEKLIEDSDIPPGSRLALAARLEIKKGNREAAAAKALESHHAMSPKDPAAARRLLAHTLHSLGLSEQAFDAWKSFVVRGTDSPDFREMLRCAYDAGKHQFVLEECSKFSAQGMSSRFYVSLECYILQFYDPERAFARLSQAIVDFPADVELSFLYACVALRTGRKAEAARALVPGRMPSPESASPDIATLVARALLDIGRPDDAVSFVYSFLRMHWGDPVAHRLYIAILTRAPESRADQPTVAAVDTAVCFKDGDGKESWVILEADEANPQLALNETAVRSSLGSALLGKTVGESIILSRGVEPRTVEIIALQNKYSYRLQDVMNNSESRFGSPEVVQSLNLPDDPVKLVSVGSPLLRAAVRRRDYVRSLSDAYANGTLTVYRLAEALCTDPISCQMGLVNTDAGVLCGIPDGQLLQLCRDSLAARDEVFVDTSAMATWILLDLTEDVARWPWRLVTTRSCLDVLRAFEADMRDTRERGALSVSDGSVSITPLNLTVASAIADRARQIASTLTVIDSRPLAALPNERRKQLEQLFGSWGAEAIACAAQPDRVLWTDDALLAQVAVAHGAVPASSQAIINSAAARNAMPTTRELELCTSLFVANYEPLNAPNEFIRHLVASSNGQVTSPSMSRLLEKMTALGPPDWLRIARIVVADAMLNLELPESRSAAVIAVLETVRDRRDARPLLLALVRSVRGLFSLHVIREDEFLKTVAAWVEQAEI